jgi:hypothetical protein
MQEREQREREKERELELKFVGFRKSQFAIIYFLTKRLSLFFSNELNQNVLRTNVKCKKLMDARQFGRVTLS